MNMETVGLIVGGWFVLALGVSLILGTFLRGSGRELDEQDVAEVADRQRVVRYLRRKSARGAKSDHAASGRPVPRRAEN